MSCEKGHYLVPRHEAAVRLAQGAALERGALLLRPRRLRPCNRYGVRLLFLPLRLLLRIGILSVATSENSSCSHTLPANCRCTPCFLSSIYHLSSMR